MQSIIKESQPGFVNNRSCLNNLLVLMEEVTNYVDSGQPVDILYLDFQKAFDKVPHSRLLMKLAAHGINENVMKWIEGWLCGRRQRVVLNGQVSERKDILSGVQQGSVLGPILFVIYINDIDENVSSRILKSADDTEICHKVHTHEPINSLHCDLCNLFSWSTNWQMLFNIEKCKVMHLGFNNFHATYHMDGLQLQTVSDEKDLEVIISDDMKWEKQCSAAVLKANSILGMIKRNFVDRSPDTIMALYLSLIHI